MTTEALARMFEHPRREGRVYRARCPVHGGKSLTLAITPREERSTVHCFAGCASDDVLAAVGLTWKDTFYQDKRIDRKAWLAEKRKREAAEKRASELRVGMWIIRFAENGYTREDRDRDITVLCACAIVLSHGPDRTWEDILRTTTERIAAAGHCLERRMLPSVAQNRQWL